MKKRIISVLLCVILLSGILIMPTSAIHITEEESIIDPSSTAVEVLEKDLDTNIVEEKIYSRDSNGIDTVKTVDSWTDDETKSFTSATPMLPDPAAELNGIIDTDDRTEVKNTKIFPYSAIVHLEIFFGLNVYRGTGFLIADDVVVTAAHCLYSEEYGWATNVTVRPGRNGALIPFGLATSKSVAVSKEYYANFDSNYDWGAIRVHKSFVGEPGAFNLKVFENTGSVINARISGYPAEVASKKLSTTKQYEMSGTVIPLGDYRFFYTIDSSGGQSGAPILNENNEVIGIHTSGSDLMNSGVRITPQVSYYLNEFVEGRI